MSVPPVVLDSPAVPNASPQNTAADTAEINRLLVRCAAEHKAGKLKQLERTLNEIVELDPNHPEALFNLAILHRDRRDITAAEILFRRSIKADPMRIDAYQGLGELLYNARHLTLAISIFRRGLERAPTRLPLLASLSRCFMQLRRSKEVAHYCEQILAITPDDEDALWQLAWSQIMLGQADKALTTLDHLAAISPGNQRARVLRQIACERLGRQDEAERLWLGLLDGMPADWTLFKSITELYSWSGLFERSYELVDRYISRLPDSMEAMRELCVLQMNDGNFAEAQRTLEVILKQHPDSAQLLMVRALNAFRVGDYETAFKYYEARWGRDTHDAKWDLPIPDWDGSPLEDGELLIFAEQGVGDHVMSAHLFPELRHKAKRVTLETTVRLISLFQRSFPDMSLVDRNNLPKNWKHHHLRARAAMADLPILLKADMEKLPHRDGYLVPDPALMKKLRQRYQERFPGKKLVGISWRSGNRDSAVIRSIDLPHWRRIFEVPDCAFISLQYGAVDEDIAALKEELGVEVLWDPEIDPMMIMDPFAAQVAAMDLVISVDNSTIHFAGALGVPCWAMLPVNSDWRWQLERSDTIWYSSLRLFRSLPENGGDWAPVIGAVADRLAHVSDIDLAAARAEADLRCMRVMHRFGRVSDAEEFARRLVESGAHTGEAMHIIGLAALQAGVAQDAVQILSRAMALRPGDSEILGDLIGALDASGQPQQAERLARDALRQAETDAKLLNALGQLLTRQRRFDEATDYFARILRHRPEDVEARQALARLQMLEGETELAQINFNKALNFDPNFRAAHVGLAEIMLREPEPSTEAWQHFMWRFAERPGEMPRHLAMVDPDLRPDVWTGGKLRRQRLLLRAERTLLEQLMFTGLLEQLTGTSRPGIIECDQRLLPLLNLPNRKWELRPAGATLPAELTTARIQMIASLGDLAGAGASQALRQGVVAAPAIRPDEALVRSYRDAYQSALPGRRLVGLSWREPGVSAGLTLLLEQIVPFLLRNDLGIVLLQSDQKAEEVAALSEVAGIKLPVLDPHGDADLARMAARLAALDAVVTAEEMTAHLAAAAGVKTVKLCGRLAHWAWGDRNQPCIWYPDARSIHLSSAEQIADLPEIVAALLR
ncbi:tetratricopeptide repeat protein [Dongia sp.]|uniref:tetratricopeptide repeat protein n=1 Tax=Dongia sp. TaxID=1977262 RepID=UPI0035AF404A